MPNGQRVAAFSARAPARGHHRINIPSVRRSVGQEMDANGGRIRDPAGDWARRRSASCDRYAIRSRQVQIVRFCFTYRLRRDGRGITPLALNLFPTNRPIAMLRAFGCHLAPDIYMPIPATPRSPAACRTSAHQIGTGVSARNPSPQKRGRVNVSAKVT